MTHPKTIPLCVNCVHVNEQNSAQCLRRTLNLITGQSSGSHHASPTQQQRNPPAQSVATHCGTEAKYYVQADRDQVIPATMEAHALFIAANAPVKAVPVNFSVGEGKALDKDTTALLQKQVAELFKNQKVSDQKMEEYGRALKDQVKDEKGERASLPTDHTGIPTPEKESDSVSDPVIPPDELAKQAKNAEQPKSAAPRKAGRPHGSKGKKRQPNT